jgi:tyrosyl-tRNA synthetase
MPYDFKKLKSAILFNTVEVLPTDEKQLDQEIQNLVDLANSSGQKIRHYIGFEISGQIHFPGSVYQMLNIAKLQDAGVECMVWLADYHTKINKKLDGKMKTIRAVAEQYFEPVLRKCLEVAGGNSKSLTVLYAKDEYFRKNDDDLSFWDFEFEIEGNITLSRILRSLSIAGKEGGESVDYQVTRYPGMQAADVFWHQSHIVQAGLDQRKIYVIARDNSYNLNPEFQLKLGEKSVKPIALFNELLLGLESPKIGKER